MNAKGLLATNHNVPYFDESLRFYSEKVYHLIAEYGGASYNVNDYKKIFPNEKEENLIVVEKAGHYIQDDCPEETKMHILNFLNDIDKK